MMGFIIKNEDSTTRFEFPKCPFHDLRKIFFIVSINFLSL